VAAPPRPSPPAFVAAILLTLAPVVAPAQQRPDDASRPVDVPRLRVGTPTSPIRLDGVLDEPAWQLADSIPDLRQVEPREGGPASARTVVRVLAEGDALVIGIRADDPDPAHLTAFSRQRDADLKKEDHVRVVIDSYLDARSGYVFAVNPYGARYDALIARQGEDDNANWDAVWEAHAARSATGWSVEIRIPAKSLLFRRGLMEWGFNVERRIQRLQETDRWASPVQGIRITNPGRAGRLVGIPAFELGLGLSVRPAVTASSARVAPATRRDAAGDVSLDATQRVGANALASLTVNTDFAETEVDSRQTNLTRFPLVFPEKRTFFLEGSDIFDFGLGTGDDVRSFFSRRIGLIEGIAVPIDAGLKVNGREGGTSYGALLVRTRDVDSLPSDATLGAVRIKRNLFGESSVGAIATVGDPLGRPGAWTGGADLTLKTSRFRGDRNLLAGIWGLAMGREGLGGRRQSFGGLIDYPNDRWDVNASYKWIGEAFDPSLGFVPRPGVQMASVGVDYQPRPKRPVAGLHVRQMFHEFRASVVTDLDGTWESYRVFMAPVNWRLESGDRFEFNIVPVGERLRAPFEIEDGVTIPGGSYRGTRYRLEGELATKRRFGGQATWWFGRFYSGRLQQLELEASWKPSPLVMLELTGERNAGHLAEGSFTQDLAGGRLSLTLTPDLQLASLVQYDNESENVGTNTRLRWTFVPQGELFLVYNHNVRTLDPLTGRRQWVYEANALLLKVQYALRY
jgi:Domain of unknown function (DUF5916)